MLHGPCGHANPNAPCMNDGKCSKRYPKEYAEETSIGENDYSIYRRRNNGDSFLKNKYLFTNRDVISHNPYLSQTYNCHINVEIATSITAIKYLYKYIYKSHDRTAISIQREQGEIIDEIQDYLDARYVSASESC